MTDQVSSPENQKPAARKRNSRRNFLRTAGGVAAGTALFVAGCDGESIPENQNPTATLEVDQASLEDNPQDDLMVTFNVEYGDPDVQGQDAFDDSVTDARIELSNGDMIDLPMEDGTSQSVDYTFNQRGQKTATLIVEDNFSGRATDEVTFMVGAMAASIDFGTDVGVLNFAYALEQLEAAFYAQVVSSLDDGNLSFGSEEAAHYFNNLAAQEAIHRDFLEAAIGANGGDPLPMLVPDFSSVTFSDPNSVLGTAQVLEDTGVSAYNGAADMLSNPQFLTIAGKIVSVEARHASAVRALIEPMTQNFADLTELTDLGADPENALDVLQEPDAVLTAASGFITTPIEFTGL